MGLLQRLILDLYSDELSLCDLPPVLNLDTSARTHCHIKLTMPPVCVFECPQLSSTSSWLGVGNVLCAAKSTQELIVLIIAVRSSPGIIAWYAPLSWFCYPRLVSFSTRD